MNIILRTATFILFSGATIISSCTKTDPAVHSPVIPTPPPPPPPPPSPPSPPPPPSTVVIPCSNRPLVQARLVPVGMLSQGRIAMGCATAGTKILFAGGMITGAYSSRVDIYDMETNTWSTAELTQPERQGMAVASVGNKILFAGGGDNDGGITTSRVDIYDVSTNAWTTAELSKRREYLAAATLGNRVFFSGGGDWEPHLIGSTVVDIYDNSTNSWSTASLSEGRMDHSATTIGNKIYFAGGTRGYYTSLGILNTVDIYDGATNSWYISSMREPRSQMASIAVGDNIYWGSGINSNSLTLSDSVEIRNVITGNTTITCMKPKNLFNAVVKDDNIIFFPGMLNQNDPLSGTHFEIYNTTTKQWSTGVLNKTIHDAAVISVNNTIYIAGGRDQLWGPYFREVWKLEF